MKVSSMKQGPHHGNVLAVIAGSMGTAVSV